MAYVICQLRRERSMDQPSRRQKAPDGKELPSGRRSIKAEAPYGRSCRTYRPERPKSLGCGKTFNKDLATCRSCCSSFDVQVEPRLTRFEIVRPAWATNERRYDDAIHRAGQGESRVRSRRHAEPTAAR